jgi:hypothetical protein
MLRSLDVEELGVELEPERGESSSPRFSRGPLDPSDG